jgi:hypothetical protein
VSQEQVRAAVLEKLVRALDSPADGQMPELIVTRVVIEGLTPAVTGG